MVDEGGGLYHKCMLFIFLYSERDRESLLTTQVNRHHCGIGSICSILYIVILILLLRIVFLKLLSFSWKLKLLS